MRIRHTFVITDDDRRALWFHNHGASYVEHPRRNPARCPKAKRAECKRMLLAEGEGMYAYLRGEHRQAAERWAKRQIA